MRKGVFAVLVAGVLSAPVQAQVLDANFVGPFTGSATINNTRWLAQTFTVQQTGRLTSFDVEIGSLNGGSSVFQIWNVTAGTPAAVESNPTVLASAQVVYTGSGSFGADISSANLNVQAGEVYALVQIAGQTTGSGGWRTGAVSDVGQSFVNFGSSWGATGAGTLGFRTFVTTNSVAVPEPATFAMLALGLAGLVVVRRRGNAITR